MLLDSHRQAVREKKQKSWKSGHFGNFFQSEEDNKTIFQFFIFFTSFRNFRWTKQKSKIAISLMLEAVTEIVSKSIPSTKTFNKNSDQCFSATMYHVTILEDEYIVVLRVSIIIIAQYEIFHGSLWKQQTNKWKNCQFLRHQKVDIIVLKVR